MIAVEQLSINQAALDDQSTLLISYAFESAWSGGQISGKLFAKTNKSCSNAQLSLSNCSAKIE